ncbi:hypothetical protein WJX72_011603 [[Myrmecia] bisecta]|uniref:3'-5' exonuclease domain-containing protein n=1 Tax=[Myrmecia] bisecta TaxID=41462 RepID=A0AAW1P6P0_9CHLO
MQDPVLAIDLEWRPDFGPHRTSRVALIQLASATCCVLIRTCRLSFHIPPVLQKFLESPEIVMVGYGWDSSDESKMQQSFKLGRACFGTFVDLQTISEHLGYHGYGLGSLTRMVLGFDLQKARSVSMSNWEAKCLTPSQMAPPASTANGRDQSSDRQQKHGSFVPSIPEVPVTLERPVPQNATAGIKNAGAPRANQVVSKEEPEGRAAVPNRTVLQQHVDFWDFDKDGMIYPADTFRGFHAIGFNWFLSFIAIFVIHGTFSYPSNPSWIPNLLFPIYTQNMHKTKHGSDTEVFDTEGRFVPQKLEELFTKYDEGNKGGLTLKEIMRFTEAMRNVLDPTGWTAAKLEWGATYYLLRENGMVTKEKIKGVYDGSIWYTLARENKAKAQLRLPWYKRFVNGLKTAWADTVNRTSSLSTKIKAK